MTDSQNSPFDLASWRDIPERRTQVLRRMFVLREMFKRELLGKRGWRGVEINQEILAHAVYCYFVDLDRYKEFHSIKLADAHKRAAFTIKWIMACRPLQVLAAERGDNRTYPFLANEVFAVHAGLNQMDIDFSKFRKRDGYLPALIYKLHFRPLVAETLITEMYAVDRAINGGEL